MNINLGHTNNFVEIGVWFKAIDGPPEIERASDYLNDISSSCGHSVQHVELRMTNGDVYTADVNHGVVCKPDKDHAIVTNESFWVGYTICMPISEANAVQNFSKLSVGQGYSFLDLARGFFGGCCVGVRSGGNLSANHTCTSFCFEALAQSDTFCKVLADCNEDFRQRKYNDASFFTCNPSDFRVYLDSMVDICSTVQEHSGIVVKNEFSCDKGRVADIDDYKRMHEKERQRRKEYHSFSSSSGSDADIF